MKSSPPECLLAFATSILALTSSLFCQVGGSSEAFYHLNGSSTNQEFGQTVAYLGDINNDGFDDMLIGAPKSDPGGRFDAGSVFVYSGADGSLLLQLDGLAAGDNFGYSVSGLKDTNADGKPEIIVGAPFADPGGVGAAGSAYLYSGATGALIHQWDGATSGDLLGGAVADAGDINQDNVPDIIVGADHASPGGITVAGSTYVYSGFTGTLLMKHDGQAPFDHFGASVAGVGDINSDGFPDIAVGATNAELSGGLDPGVVYTFSGLTTAPIHQWEGVGVSENFGWAITGISDMDGDGVNEVVVGAPNAERFGSFSVGRVAVFSGSTGVLVRDWYGEATGDNLGFSVASVGDQDLDGVPDVLAGAPYVDAGGVSSSGAAYLLSGGNGTILHQWTGVQTDDEFGFSVASCGDVNNDGKSDVLLGAHFANPGGLTSSGSAHAYDFHAFCSSTANEFSAAAGGAVPFTMDFPVAASGHNYMTLMSISGTGPVTFGVDIPLGADRFLFDSAVGVYPFPTHTGMHGILDAQGDASANISFAPGIASNAVGITLWFAAVAVPSGQVLPTYSSVAIPIVIAP